VTHHYHTLATSVGAGWPRGGVSPRRNVQSVTLSPITFAQALVAGRAQSIVRRPLTQESSRRRALHCTKAETSSG
jgi:hypothetical protein